MVKFIEQYHVDEYLCKRIIDYFEENSDKRAGAYGSNKVVCKTFKDSTDVVLDGHLLRCYVEELDKHIQEYKKAYVYCDVGHHPWSIFPNMNVQRYLPGEGFHSLHTERCSGYGDISRRHLVFMTYLNDVTDDGETFFYYQDLKVKPKAGLTLIWPADWTFTHCGITSNTQTKYIVTGWISYTPHQQFSIAVY
jgi:hypothetical protein